jgi:hypothetical protein
VLCLKDEGHTDICPVQTAREVKTAVSDSIITQMLQCNQEELQQAAEEREEASKVVALLMQQEALTRDISLSNGRTIPFVLPANEILKAAVVYDLNSDHLHANLHLYDPSHTPDMERYMAFSSRSASELQVEGDVQASQPSTSAPPVVFSAEEYESYRGILDNIGWNMVQDDADEMANVGSLTARQWLSQLNSNERITLAVRRLYMKTAKVVAMQNPTKTVLQEQYAQAEEEYSGTLGAYMQLIRESWHLHKDEAPRTNTCSPESGIQADLDKHCA